MASSNCPYADSRSHISLPMLPSQPSLEQVSGAEDELDITDISWPSETPVKPGSPVSTEHVQHPLGLAHNTLHVPGQIRPNSCSIGYESLVITAATILAIQLQLLTSGSMATTASIHALLSFGMIFELLAILLAICLPQRHQYSDGYPSHHPLPTLVHLASVVPKVLVLIGIIGLATALVVETLKTSLITAVAMSGVLIIGVILCAFTSRFGACGRL